MNFPLSKFQANLLGGFTALVLLVFIVTQGFVLIESLVVQAASSTVTTTSIGSGNAVTLSYPVELSVNSELALTCDISTSTMLSSIMGMTGGVASSSRNCLVTTSNLGGWTMTAKASSSPALVSVASTTINFPDAALTPAGWSSPSANTSKFGFNASGNYADPAFGGGLYRGFNGSNPITIGSNTGPTGAGGETIYMNYKAEVGSSASQPAGLYRSWTTITAYMN